MWVGVKDEKFWYCGCPLKNSIFGGGVGHEKKHTGGDCIKRGKEGLDSVQIQEGAWQKEGGGIFERGLIPQCILWPVKSLDPFIMWSCEIT